MRISNAIAGLRPDPQQAEDWLRAELSRREYQPSLRERITGWVEDLVNKVANTGADLRGLGWPAVALLVVVVVGLAAFALSRAQRASAVDGSAGVFDDVRRPAADHRRLAEVAFATGEWDTVVVEAVRWLAADLAERSITPDDPGITTGEMTELATPRFPDQASQLGEAARSFEEVRYGGRVADRNRADRVLAAARDVTGATPTARAGGPTLAVPR